MIVQWLDQIIGTLPSYSTSQNPSEYYSIVRYVIAGVVLMFLISLVYRLFLSIFGKWLR